MGEQEKLGVWLIGARGGLATTVMVGAKALARGLAPRLGLVTESPPLKGLQLIPIEKMVFGGCDIQKGTILQTAERIAKATGTFDREMLQELKEDLNLIEESISSGTWVNCGPAIEQLADRSLTNPQLPLKEQIRQIQQAVREFKQKNHLEHVVVVNVASTEPLLNSPALTSTLGQMDELIEKNRFDQIRAGTLYAYAVTQNGYPLINFTPSNSYFLPAIEELAHLHRVPYMGNDGKTGESLVKTILAPMFAYRNLKVLSWQGYNILGNQDGLVLADESTKKSKIRTKEPLVAEILGYPLHSGVGIDYVPSLDDWKTAWDFIHFQGFLNVKMSCQFIWQGCDSILAAPLVLDLVRFAHFARQQGEWGPMAHLACYFKSPLHQNEHNFHKQYEVLTKYAQRHSANSQGVD